MTTQPALFNVGTMKLEDYDLQEINLDLIEEEIAPETKELTASFGEMEMVQFPVVTPSENGHYRVISGKRRILSARLNNATSLICVIKKHIDDKTFHLQSLAANTGKRNWADEADHVQELVDKGMSCKQIAKQTGMPITDVYQLRRIKTDLIPEFADAMRAGDIVWSTIIELMKIRSKEVQQELYNQFQDEGKLTGATVYERKQQEQSQSYFAGLDQAPPVQEQEDVTVFIQINVEEAIQDLTMTVNGEDVLFRVVRIGKE
jgi:ParB-like chromosome segregation protein Spo0J